MAEWLSNDLANSLLARLSGFGVRTGKQPLAILDKRPINVQKFPA